MNHAFPFRARLRGIRYIPFMISSASRFWKRFDWAEDFGAAITVVDKNLDVIYMNNKAAVTFKKWGGHGLLGKNLVGCHNERSMAIMRRILETGVPNTYTIEKDGLKKMIYQAPWTRDGNIAGLVEISMVIPSEMEHYVRD